MFQPWQQLAYTYEEGATEGTYLPHCRLVFHGGSDVVGVGDLGVLNVEVAYVRTDDLLIHANNVAPPGAGDERPLRCFR